MTAKSDWEGGVGRNWASEWQRTDRSFAALTAQLLARIATEPGRCIVDIGCGAGELSLALAQARPGASIVGVDVSADLVAAAAARAEGCTNLRFELADASVWTHPDGPPDLYVSRHGVMFFPDPPAAFAHLAASAAPGARIVFSCFRTPAENEWASEIAKLLPPPEPEPAQEFVPGPFAFADPAHVRRCMVGWRDITFTPVDFTYVAGDGDDPVAEAMAFFRRIGPTAFAMRTLPERERELFETALQAMLETRNDGQRVTFPAAAWVVCATADQSKR